MKPEQNLSRIPGIREAGRGFLVNSKKAGEATLQRARKSYGSLWEAYEIVCGLLVELSEILSRDPGNVEISDETSKRMSLTASMVQGSTATEHLISSGQYVLAAGATRQYLETLARIAELRVRAKKLQKAKHKIPNVKLLPFGLSKDYGRLSEIVHTTRDEFLGSFVELEGKPGVADLLPSFKNEWAEDLFCRQIAIMTTLVGEIDYLAAELHPSSRIPGFDLCMDRIIEILVDVGYLKRV